MSGTYIIPLWFCDNLPLMTNKIWFWNVWDEDHKLDEVDKEE